LGTYHVAFTTAGLLALGAAALVLTIRQGRGPLQDGRPLLTVSPGPPGALATPRAATR
jgi:hypothetical protein